MTESAGPALAQLHRDFGDQIAFVSLYVREAHPGDRYSQPHTAEEKMRHARDYQRRDGIVWPIAVDDVDGALHRQLDEKPHSVYLVGADGRLATRLLWGNDESALREVLATVARRGSAVLEQRENKLVPMLSGLGQMSKTLDAAGEVAKRDVRREVPPMWGMARLADLFEPLPPLGRGIAAMATATLGVAAVAFTLWELLRDD